MRPVSAILLLLAFVAQVWLTPPLRASGPGAAPPHTCACCASRGCAAACCAAPVQPVPNATSETPAPLRSLSSDDLCSPPAGSENPPLPLPRTRALAPVSLATVATADSGPLFLRGCALLI